MKKSVLILFTLVGIGIGFVAYGRCTGTAGELAVGTVASHAVPSPSSKEQRLQEKALAAKAYCIENGFNTNYCFLIDFSIPSGKKRFFVWDFKGDSIKYSSLCAHGYGKESTLKKPVYSNVEGSYCSSLGKYKVGIRSYSKWELMCIINCMGWNRQIAMLSNDISYCILILRCRLRRYPHVSSIRH